MGNMSRNLSDFRMLCLYLVSHLRKKAVMDKVEDPERCAPLDNKLYTVLRASRVHFSVYISTIIIVNNCTHQLQTYVSDTEFLCRDR